MAKLQRWRRRDRSGEGDGPVEVEETADDEPGDDTPDDPGETDAVEEAEEVGVDPETDPDDLEDAPDPAPDRRPATDYGGGTGFELREWLPYLLLQSAHPKQAVVTALGVGVVAFLTGRPAEETGVIVATVLLGQMVLGWHNDLVDRGRDRAHDTPGKPLADGRLSTANAWTTLVIVALVVVPLAVTTGVTAGLIFLFGYVAVGMLGNVLFRTGMLSFWSWAVSYGVLPAYLSYGGWGGQALGSPPETAIVVLAALLGIGVHFLRSVWGLVADHEDGWTYLPLKLGLKLGATRLLVLTTLYLVAVVVGMLYAGVRVGLSQ